jgi:hypothetical protein
MAYQSGDTILDDHYNGFASSINTIMGTGSGDSGYGQSTVSSVSAGSTITATQWVNLLNKISTAASHQGSSITSITNPTTGDTISAYTALSGNITTVTNNRRNAAATGTSSATASSGTNTWRDKQTTTFTVQFASANAARYFWNAGGLVSLSFSRSGGTSSSKNTAWTALCSAAGTVYISGGSGNATIGGTTYSGTDKIGGSGSATVNDNYGWYDLTTSAVQNFKQNDATYLYTANYIQTQVRRDSGSDALLVTVNFIDAADSSNWGESALRDETVNGTLTATLNVIKPSTTHLSDAVGTVTVTKTAMGGDTY